MKVAVWAGLPGALLLSPVCTSALIASRSHKGILSSESIKTFVNQVIKDRLRVISNLEGIGRQVPDDVTFGHLAQGWPTVVPLKIVATDVERGTLELFDASSTPDVIVAEAVAASISIPLVFYPALIPSYRPGFFADGGLVSNFPVWVFAEEKLAFEREYPDRPPVPIIGFSLRENPHAASANLSQQSGILEYLSHLVNATLQGSQAVATQFLEDVSVIPLSSDLNMLAFDRTWDEYEASRRRAWKEANRHLRHILHAKPDRIRAELSKTRLLALAEINALRTAAGRPAIDQLRINLIEPFGKKSLRVVASVGMGDDADDRLSLDRRGGGAAEAFRTRDLSSFRLALHQDGRRQKFMTKYEEALIRRSVRSALCVPIFRDTEAWALEAHARPEPAGVFAVDSDQDLVSEFENSDLRDLLVDQSAVLYGAVSMEADDA